MFLVVGLPLLIQVEGNQIKIGLAAPGPLPVFQAVWPVGQPLPHPNPEKARLRRLLLQANPN